MGVGGERKVGRERGKEERERVSIVPVGKHGGHYYTPAGSSHWSDGGFLLEFELQSM